MTQTVSYPLNILLVDDNAFARSAGRRALQSAGVISILEASCGQEAIGLLAPSIDVVFCDLMMPDMDGIQLFRHMAALAKQPACVIVSGADPVLLTVAADAARTRGLQVLGSIEKPMTPASVRRVLAQFDKTTAPAYDRSFVSLTRHDFDRAFAEDQFRLHFQPKVALADNSVVGFEALARWPHPEKGWIGPDDFIPAAEQNGSIGALTELITTMALKQCAAWSLAGIDAKMSINLSAHTLVDLELPDRLADQAESFGVVPRRFILEITESGLFQNMADTLDILARLHMRGFPLSIDDFGTGYSSMEQLRRVPFAEMKIDRAFVHGAANSAKSRAILDSSATLGRALEMSVVAEGAETPADWAVVRDAGIDIVQGYFIAKPMAAEQVPAWLADWVRRG